MLNWKTLNMLEEEKDDENKEERNVSKINWSTFGTKDISGVDNIKKIIEFPNQKNSYNNTTKQTDEERNLNKMDSAWQKDEDQNVTNKTNVNNAVVSNNASSNQNKSTENKKTITLPANSITVNKDQKSYRDIEAKLPSNIKANKVANSKETENAVMVDTKKPTIFEAGEFEDGYQFGDITKTVLGTATDFTQDLSKGIVSIGENVLDIATNIVASVQNLMGFQEVAKNTRNLANKDLSENVSNVVANVNPIGMLYNIVNGTPDKIFNPAGVTWNKDKNIIENYTNNFNKTWLEENNEKQNYEKSSVLGDYADKAVSLVGYTLGMKLGSDVLSELTGTKNIGSSKLGASLSGGNIGLKLGGHTLNLSTLAFTGGMAEGLQEANSKGEYVTEAERWSKAFSSGTIETFTEGIFGFLGVGGNDITEKWAKKIVSNITSKAGKYLASLGISASSEAAEEFLSYLLNFIVDNGIIDKIGPTDFSKDWDSGEVIESMVLAFVSTGLTGGGSFVIGTNSAVKEAENQLGRKLSNEEKNEVTKAVVDATIDERLGQIVGQTSIDDISEFYTTKFDQNGDIQGITPTLGKQIENVNNKVNVKPVIVKNAQTNTYNVVDGKTGLVLDSSPYRNLVQAQAEFAHKMVNLDNASINAINSKVGQANIAISNKMQQVVEQARDILDYNQNLNTSQTSQNQFTGNLSNETTNYANQDIENVTDGNKNNNITINNSHERTFIQEIDNYKNNSTKQNTINENVTQVNNNILDGISKRKQSQFMNEYLKNEVNKKDYYVGKEKIIANKYTIGKLKNGNTNFDRRIPKSIRYELKANIIGNLENIIKTSTIKKADIPDTKGHDFANTFDRRVSIFNYQGQNYEVMFEVGKKNGLNTLYSIENIKKTQKNRFSFPNLDSERVSRDTKNRVRTY